MYRTVTIFFQYMKCQFLLDMNLKWSVARMDGHKNPFYEPSVSTGAHKSNLVANPLQLAARLNWDGESGRCCSTGFASRRSNEHRRARPLPTHFAFLQTPTQSGSKLRHLERERMGRARCVRHTSFYLPDVIRPFPLCARCSTLRAFKSFLSLQWHNSRSIIGPVYWTI